MISDQASPWLGEALHRLRIELSDASLAIDQAERTREAIAAALEDDAGDDAAVLHAVADVVERALRIVKGLVTSVDAAETALAAVAQRLKSFHLETAHPNPDAADIAEDEVRFD